MCAVSSQIAGPLHVKSDAVENTYVVKSNIIEIGPEVIILYSQFGIPWHVRLYIVDPDQTARMLRLIWGYAGHNPIGHIFS